MSYDHKYALINLLLILLCLGCGDDMEIIDPPVEEEMEEEIELVPMVLDDLQPGQKYTYILYKMANYFGYQPFEFEYTGDTVVVEIVSKVGDSLLVQEKLTPNSNLLVNGNHFKYRPEPDLVAINYWSVRNDSLFVTGNSVHLKSHLMFVPKLDLKPYDNCEIEMEEWLTTLAFKPVNQGCYTLNYEYLDTTFNRLNVFRYNKILSDDGPGYTTIYSRENGILHTVYVNGSISAGYGWDRIK